MLPDNEIVTHSLQTGLKRSGQQSTPTALSLAWDVFVFVAATFGAIALPAFIVGGSELVPHAGWYEAFLTVIFIGDLVIRIRRHDDAPGIRRWLLLGADTVAALPLQLLTANPVLSLLRLAKLARVGSAMGRWRYQHLTHWNTLRLIYFVYWLALCVHWLTLGWLSIKQFPSSFEASTGYIHSLYWCVSTLTTIGYSGTVAVTNPEIIYSIVVMIFGVATYGYVIANAANILVNIDPARTGYFDHMEKLSSFMNYRGIPSELQRRVRDYHAYIWEHRLGYNEEEILGGLPSSLMTEVSLYLKRDIIQHVHFFAVVSESLLRDIAHSMHSEVCMPGDLIFSKGEIGNAMYFVSRGEVEVLEEDGSRRAVLRKGDAFGEMALVLNKPRSATVRAIGWCDLYRLDKSAFDDIIGRYPEFAEHFQALAKQRRRSGRGSDTSPGPET